MDRLTENAHAQARAFFMRQDNQKKVRRSKNIAAQASTCRIKKNLSHASPFKYRQFSRDRTTARRQRPASPPIFTGATAALRLAHK
jgi:hypothetical protein